MTHKLTSPTIEVTQRVGEQDTNVVLEGMIQQGVLTVTSNVSEPQDLFGIGRGANDIAIQLIKAAALHEASAMTGGHVKILQDHACCPVLIGDDDEPVFLYQFVEAMDGAIDYDDIKDEFSNLSYAQINSAIRFLRKISQFNTQGIDIDELEEQSDIQDPEFIEEVRRALLDKDTSRVLTKD